MKVLYTALLRSYMRDLALTLSNHLKKRTYKWVNYPLIQKHQLTKKQCKFIRCEEKVPLLYVFTNEYYSQPLCSVGKHLW